jgi:hypothetical protein
MVFTFAELEQLARLHDVSVIVALVQEYARGHLTADEVTERYSFSVAEWCEVWQLANSGKLEELRKKVEKKILELIPSLSNPQREHQLRLISFEVSGRSKFCAALKKIFSS